MSDVNYSWELNNIANRLSSVEKGINDVRYQVNAVGNEISAMGGKVDQVSHDVAVLTQKFESMMNEQRKNAALQQALTELVRIRQELEQRFGGYREVRETMLGVLQATDVALVKKNTISRVSEELMISTPEYWLAPCLVAVSAWISNDRDLADRAIREAMKRNEERTALTMALICRRNNRIDTCYEWLSIYFAKQKATSISASSYAYIDAYVNGIFGPDEKHMCDDYISRWLDEIRGSSSNFESDQEDLWKGYCAKFKGTVEERYPALKNYVAEYDRIDEYLGRVQSVGAIENNFKQIQNAYVNQDILKEKIDKNLIELVSKYDEKEMPLRQEEELQQAIKKFQGDEHLARIEVARKREGEREEMMNLVEQMSNAIISEKDVLPSQKKTALSFLGGYIKKGFNTYINEVRPDFPETVTINVNGWSGTTTDGSNINELCQSYDAYVQNSCSHEKNMIMNSKPTAQLAGGIACGIAAFIFLFVFFPLTIVCGAGAGVCFFSYSQFDKKKQQKLNLLEASYKEKVQQGQNQIKACVEQWKEARTQANDFSQGPAPELIA